MGFSATEAAFEGFRVVRRKPLALVWWAGAYLLVMAMGFALIAAPLVNLMVAMQTLQSSSAAPDMTEFQPVWAAYGAIMPIVFPLGIIFGAVMNAAIVRSVVSPQSDAFGYMRLGMDEVRTAVVTLVLTILSIIVSVLVFGLVGIMFGFAAAAEMPLLVLVGVVATIGALVLMAWLAARLSLAVPITVAEKRIAIFDSWGLTKGRTWPIIGMAVIAFVMTVVVSLLGSLIFLPLTMMVGAMNDWTALEGMALPEILAAVGPALAVSILVQAVMSSLQLAVVYAPFSAAYRDIKAS
jgi:hypothetical protein